ncbi:MAG TPA: hypothetical protein PLP73_02565 [Candidatus Absconditabacterales bacterium]|nr:hypothetical protein [Candidatus Absconditabacterales bacterium]
MVGYYIKKPEIVEALEYNGNNNNDVVNLCGSRCYFDDGQLYIITYGGYLKVSVGDFIIHDGHDQFHICKHDIFVEDYEQTSLTDVVKRSIIRRVVGGIIRWLKEKLNIFKLWKA